VIDPFDVGQVEVPRQVAATPLTVDPIDVTVILVVFDLGDDEMFAWPLDSLEQGVNFGLTQDLGQVELRSKVAQALEDHDALFDPQIVEPPSNAFILDLLRLQTGDDRAECIGSWKRLDPEIHDLVSDP
jgi:hypothetical protein